MHERDDAAAEMLQMPIIDSRAQRGYRPQEAEMMNTIEIWRQVGGVSGLSFNDSLVTAILSEVASRALSLDRLSALGAGEQRADIPLAFVTGIARRPHQV